MNLILRLNVFNSECTLTDIISNEEDNIQWKVNYNKQLHTTLYTYREQLRA